MERIPPVALGQSLVRSFHPREALVKWISVDQISVRCVAWGGKLGSAAGDM